MKKFLILLVVIITSINLMYSQKSKSEISIGIETPIEAIISLYTIGPQFSLIIPFSYIYHTKKYFGIGFSHNFGYRATLHAGQNLYFHDLINRINITNLFENKIHTGNYLIFEYGISLVCRFSQTNRVKHHFLTGPNLFLGYKKLFSNNIILEVGFSGEIVFGYADYYTFFSYADPYDEDWRNFFITSGSLGVSTRIRFNVLK